MKKLNFKKLKKLTETLQVAEKNLDAEYSKFKEANETLHKCKELRAKAKEEVENLIKPHLKEIRKASNMNLDKLAINLGLSQSYLSQCENGLKPIPTIVILKYYELLSTSQKKNI